MYSCRMAAVEDFVRMWMPLRLNTSPAKPSRQVPSDNDHTIAWNCQFVTRSRILTILRSIFFFSRRELFLFWFHLLHTALPLTCCFCGR